MGTKVCPNRTENAPKLKTKKKTKKEALEDRLGAVLGRSWVVLGRFGARFGTLESLQTLRLPMFRENSRF